MVASLHWIDAKLTLVALMLAYFIWTRPRCSSVASSGRRAAVVADAALRSNELPVLVLAGRRFILVIAKPF